MLLIKVENNQELLKITNDYDIVIVQVGATWCKPCMAIKDDFFQFINDYKPGNSICVKIDYEDMENDDELQEILDVNKIPYFFIFHRKNKIEQFQSSNVSFIENKIKNIINDLTEKNFDISDDF